MAPAETAPLPAAELEDAELVRLCLGGDRSAFDQLVHRHQRRVYLLCYRYVNSHEDAADLAQDVFVRAYRGLRGFKGNSAFSTWLYRIAVNVCLNRVGARRPTFVPLAGSGGRGAGVARGDAGQARGESGPAYMDFTTEAPDAGLLRAERAAAVRAAIARLPRRQRATLILRVYHELPHEQIAAILGNSVGSAKGNFFHALANLKKLLGTRP